VDTLRTPIPPLKYPFIIQMPKHVEILNVDDIDDKDSIYRVAQKTHRTLAANISKTEWSMAPKLSSE